ncbi:FHA domain-containing protein [Desulforegula conservatrix]|uniref:hypothetical protein n=1 Tax=Desulforegula conservatrix TaxID=153026 RepID=UPI0004154545|nr:hypothetical protein [Desulforegula conservatrix]
MEQIKGLSLETLGGGAAVERFNRELAMVAANILDPNTPDKKARKATLELTVKPVSRNHAVIEISTKSTLANPTPYSTQIFIDRDIDGELAGVERDPNQVELPFKTPVTEVASNLIAIGDRK